MLGTREGSCAGSPPLSSGQMRKGFSLEVFLWRSALRWPELDSTGIDGSLAVLLVGKDNEPGPVCDLVEAWG